MKDLFSLKDKVAVVTGGNGGIGKAIARGLAGMGANIVIAARNEAKTKEAVTEIHEEFGTQVIGVRVDIRQEEQISALAVKARETFGRIDILVNNAGTNIRKLPQDYTAAEWDEVLGTNLRGAFLCSRAFYPAMKAAGGNVPVKEVTVSVDGRVIGERELQSAGLMPDFAVKSNSCPQGDQDVL